MGREIKRVPVGFPWPLNETWWGYISPFRKHSSSKDCDACDGSGYSPKAKEISDSWYAFENAEYVSMGNGRQYNKNAWHYNLDADDILALVKAKRLWDFTRRPRNDKQRKIVEKKILDNGDSWLPDDNGYIPTPDEVNEWARTTIGHDSINHWVCVKAKCKRLKIPLGCPVCKGEGTVYVSAEMRKVMTSWKDIEPPKGTAWQLWETVSEGSPITPPFPAPEELIKHLVNKGDAWGHKWTRSQAEAMVAEKWAPSMVMSGGRLMQSHQAVEDIHNEKLAKEQKQCQ
jgi:hypothetical protein